MYERHYWWVSQGATIEQSLNDNYIWAPQSDKRNRAWFYWDNVSKVKAGDVIFHYSDGAIRGVSVATSDGHVMGAGRTLREGGQRNGNKGWRVDVEAYELTQPVSIESIGPRLAALNLDKSPVNRQGGASPGYLYELSSEAVELIVDGMSLEGLPPELNNVLTEWKVNQQPNAANRPEFPDEFHQRLARSNLAFSQPFLRRFVASLLAKRFVILTGLSGSGKTKLAQIFARWITPNRDCYEVIAVGADWTSNENIVGYADRLNGGYVPTAALNLMLHARDNYDVPHVLILDEMNLSHVERYFADLLSAIESGEAITLHAETHELNGVPPKLVLPDNLFIIGTVNVDETTYLFSPKVLDRANVIEFRAPREQMSAFLDSEDTSVTFDAFDDAVAGAASGEGLGRAFIEAIRSAPPTLSDDERLQLKAELLLFFDALASSGAEFGFRVVDEIARFVRQYKRLMQTADSPNTSAVLDSDWFNAAMDAQIMQKLLPKLNGSRGKLGPVIHSLSLLCQRRERPPITSTGYDETSDEWRSLQKALQDAAREIGNDPAAALTQDKASLRYPLSAEKLARMWQALDQNGFVSFMEA